MAVLARELGVQSAAVIRWELGIRSPPRNSRRARGLFSAPGWPFPEARLSQASAAADEWETAAGGGLRANGCGGGLTGYPGDLIILDDPIRGREDADSEAVRESVWAWIGETLLTRQGPDAVVLVVGTRWHADDPLGRILDGGAPGWAVVHLPALAEPGDLLGRAEGDALWEARYPRAWLMAQRAEVGERSWLALYQGEPTSEKGGIFKREWLTGRYDALPQRDTVGLDVSVVQACDSSFGKGVGSDFSVIATWMGDGRFFYLADIWRERAPFHRLMRAIVAEAAEWRPHAVLVEDTAAGQSAVQELQRRTALPIVPRKVAGTTKVSRAEAVSPLLEAGRILLPSARPGWLEPWIEEHAGFPTARHDDQVDTTSLALARLRELSLAPARASVGGGTDLLDSLGSPPWGESGRLEESIHARMEF